MNKDGAKGPGIVSRFILKETQEVTFIFRELPSVESVQLSNPTLNAVLMKRLFRQTLSYWQNWTSQSCYKGRWRENVHRSALTLKLLTYEPVIFFLKKKNCFKFVILFFFPKKKKKNFFFVITQTGAVVASPTFGLPEGKNGSWYRNLLCIILNI
jgi:GH15 family glucan-1,4-alpha-glucosidase